MHDIVDRPSTTSKSTISPAGPYVDEQPRSHVLAWILWILVLCGLGVGAYFLYPKVFPSNAEAAGARGHRPPPVVVTSVARKGDMNLYLQGLGTVTALNTVTLRTRVDGELTKVAFTEGQVVKQGDLLAVVDPRPYQVQLAEAKAQLDKDQALLNNAELDLKRYQTLASQNYSVTQQQLDTQDALVKQYTAAVNSDNAMIASANLQITYCNITAPISGRIGLRLVDQGNMVHATDANGLAVIAQVQPISVVFTLPETKITPVLQKTSQGQKLTVDAYDHDNVTKLTTGSLLAVDSQADPTSATVRMKAVFDNQNNELFPNQFVNAHLLVDTLHDITLVPAAAVQHGPDDSTFVYVVKSDETVEQRNIKPGPTEGNETAIDGGLSPGETVVTDGVDKLQQGTKVVPRPATATGRPAATSRPARRTGAGAQRNAGAGNGGAAGRGGAGAGRRPGGKPADSGAQPAQQPGGAK